MSNANETAAGQNPTTTASATKRSALKNYATTAAVATAGALTAQVITTGVKAGIRMVKGEKKEAAKAAFAGVTGVLNSLRK